MQLELQACSSAKRNVGVSSTYSWACHESILLKKPLRHGLAHPEYATVLGSWPTAHTSPGLRKSNSIRFRLSARRSTPERGLSGSSGAPADEVLTALTGR
jgi:hypothetical protein